MEGRLLRLRDEKGLFIPGELIPAMDRFIDKCSFDPLTGCVLWTGGTTKGRGKTAEYGVFKYQGAQIRAHRWSARHIHGLEIEGLHVDHCCPLDRAGPSNPLPPNTLCVEHLQALTNEDNVSIMHTRQLWLLTQIGVLEPPPLFEDAWEKAAPQAVPFYDPPEWYRKAKGLEIAGEDCPF